MAESGRLRAANIGAGLMGRWHADAVRYAGHRVTAVVDSRPEQAQKLAHAMDANVFTLDDALNACDVVHVCVPVDAHEAVTRRAFAASKSVICEKPLALNADATRALFDAARDAGVLLTPVHQFLFQEGVRRVWSGLAGLGTVLHVETISCTAGADGRNDADRDAVALDILPHPLSLIEHFWPGSLASQSWNVAHHGAGELHLVGSTGAFSTSILISCQGRPTRNAVHIIGSAGTATLDLYHGYAMIEHGRLTRMGKLVQPFAASLHVLGVASTNLARRAISRETAYPGLRRLIERTYAAVRDRTDGPLHAAETIAVATVGDLVRAQMKARRS